MMLVIYVLVMLLVVAIIYTKYQERQRYLKGNTSHDDLRKYLLGELTLSQLGRNTKPLLWIHVPLEYNSRHWETFGSRSSFDLNQPYLYLTTQTIVNKCSNSFQIVIIDDMSFSKLLPDWTYDPLHISSVCRINGLLRILYTYGGMVTPISFVCFKDLIGLYRKGVRNNKMFVCENVNYDTSHNYNFMPDIEFMGAEKGNPTVLALSRYIVDTDLTKFTYIDPSLRRIDDWVLNSISEKTINVVHGYEVGIMDKLEHPITIDDMMSYDYLNVDSQKAYGIWIPHRQILKRFKYQWFARLSESQIEQSKLIICKYIIHSYITDLTANEHVSDPVIPIYARSFVRFWDTPLFKGLFGLKPLYLGSEVLSDNGCK